MKGIVLAGGTGSRLLPITAGTSKQLLPIYDKPMIFYPLSVLMLAGIRDVLIIAAPASMPAMQGLLGDGARLGMNLSYAEQPEPRGIADAYIIGAKHVGNERSALILGDNLFHGAGFQDLLREAREKTGGCTLFGYPVADPERYAVAETDAQGNLIGIEEKPSRPVSNNAITGLYFYDSDVVELARGLRPSHRGELEITDVNKLYLEAHRARLVPLGRGFTWLDAGTFRSLLDASQYVQVLMDRQGVRVACVEEIALRMGFISAAQCHELGLAMGHSGYGRYVCDVAASMA
ncbi:glucose-1-phosphate thymidylyltransferase RfbA [Streptomyces silvensis]|uniref:Glucose-1-phosphate thymidylyltransferase n=1 Tax=Streptomyces silvensis TaxID=1765722 RepID=A0A0W7WXD3_9ACTN|nr:glucose-1-phosphate thymidylyltransferase RfbA [Streptomyces silvensis]KUF15261.1 glucose-1-phosphate thymidylyltransferase [Streptomyces silvensis]